MSEVLIARQPIFDVDREVAAYELLFRSPGENRAVIVDDDGATSSVVLNAFTEIGLERVVTSQRAWLNVSRDFVLGSFPQILPGDRVVLELLESAEVDERLVASLGELRTMGYSIALDDFTWHETREPLLDIAEFVKIDVLALDRPAVTELVERLRGRDVALSYRLLRYINSAYFGLRREIESIGRALVLLGLENVKLWATMTALAAVDDKPQELIVTALVRAKLSELFGPVFDEHQSGQLFTLGLFSVLDALMDAPMEEVLRSVPFPDEMTRALTDGDGSKGELVDLAIACERGDFDRLADGPVDAAVIRETYLEALEWATNTFEALTSDPEPAPA